MSKIILYDDSLEFGKTAFITPNNKIILTDEKHEIYAQKYCKGNNLTKEELILYKYWLEQKDYNRGKIYSDFLVDVLGFDKILTIMRKTITTTSSNPHVRFYNYYLMDWFIDIRNRYFYNESTGIFEPIQKDNFIIVSEEDREMESEINDIKSKVKLKDRPYFFR